MAMFPINIGIFNLILIPALMVGNLINLIGGRPEKATETGSRNLHDACRCSCTVILMIAVTWNDIMKLFLK